LISVTLAPFDKNVFYDYNFSCVLIVDLEVHLKL
jgi:hypothetical protein